MSIFNQPDFFTASQLDLDNKLILPTKALYNQLSFQVNNLYDAIRSALIDFHTIIAAQSKQVYEYPTETLTAWYAEAKTVALPVYQNFLVKWDAGTEKTSQYLHAFWNNPEQVTVDTFEPVTRYVTNATEQSGKYLQLFLDNPEQFISSAFAPITHYLSSLSQDAEAALISSYYALIDLFKLLAAQPLATLQALYQNTLSSLLDVYFDVISSLLSIVA